MDVIGAHGLGDASIQRILKQARTSVGSFYARFESKDDLILHIRSLVWGRAADRWERAVAERFAQDPGSLEEEIRWACQVLVGMLHEDPVRRELLRADPGAREDEADLSRRIRQDLASLLSRAQGEVRHPDPRTAMELGLGIVLGGAREALALESEEGGLPPDRLSEEIARAFLGYLGQGLGEAVATSSEAGSTESASPLPATDLPDEDSKPDAIDPFDVWG